MKFLKSPARAFALLSLVNIAWMARYSIAQSGDTAPAALDASFEQVVKPFLKQNCVRCHNEDTAMSGIRVDQLDAKLEDRHIKLWEAMRHRISEGTMPPKGMPQPTSAARQQLVEWITSALEVAHLRPTPKNGLVRRLTVSQYRNTLRELLQLEDDLTEILPPDAVSRDGFVNNKDTLQLSPLLLEAYLEIADQALSRSIVDPKSKPEIQNFRVDLGTSINQAPLKEELILGANSHLLNNKDFMVTQLTPTKPFAFTPFFMKTKYRFIEGYQGNDTVRGWREYDSIYHAVFACVRGSGGYPKGSAYSPVPQGLLLRPAIPNDETFLGGDGTYGPKANFKISLRELPDSGRFRVTVTAAKYNDGLVLDPDTAAQGATAAGAIVVRNPKDRQTVSIPKAGIYQVDIHAQARETQPIKPDASRLSEGLSASLMLDANTATTAAALRGKAEFVDSPFGKAVALNGDGDFLMIPRNESFNVGGDDFTVAAWIHPRQLRKAGIIALGGHGAVHGWSLSLSDNRGTLRLETVGPDNAPNGKISSPTGVIRAEDWQHVAAIVRRNTNETRLYVNGYPVARGEIGPANLDNLKLDLYLGRYQDSEQFKGDLDEVRLYRRALDEAELQALVEPGRKLVKAPPPEKVQEVTLTLGDREFSNAFKQPAFLAVRLEAGPMQLSAQHAGVAVLDRVVITPLAPEHSLSQRLIAFEKRAPKLGVHVGLRRDCGSTFAPVGPPKTVAGGKLARYVFEGAIRNFPSPDVEKDNVNYLAGVREIAVRSEYTDGRDMPRLLVKSIEFEGPFYDAWPPPPHRKIFIESTHKSDPKTYAREIIRAFAARAYRRPITASEESALMTVFQKSFSTSSNLQGSIKDTLQVVLTSPQFLFLVETSATPAPEPLDSNELASKLSYFLWNGPPDRTTMRLASSGALRKQLDSEVIRMIDDPRFLRFSREFTSQWLSLDKFQVLEPDRKRYPMMTSHNRIQLSQEPVQFVQYLIRQNLPARNLVSSDFLLVNETVANFYGMADKTENGFDFVAIQHKRPELGGVLTQAAILAGLSDGRESNPVKRGAWVARKIIAEPPDDPPPNVPTLKEDTTGLTLRQRLEQHRNQPGCQQCHTKIDPWGVPFEEFDAAGRLKAQPVDARSQLPDKTEISGTNELKRYLSEDRIDQVAFSFMKQLATYATGRTLSYNELKVLKKDGLKLKASGYPMKDMVRFVVNSKLFLEK